MGVRRGRSPVGVMFGWLGRQPMKVKSFLVVTFVVLTLVAMKLFVKNHDYFFVASEAVHAAGIIVLIYKLTTKKTCSGLSLKTQELTAVFLAVRLVCSTIMESDIHTVLDFATFVSTAWVIYAMRFKLKSTYIKELDNFNIYYIVVPCSILAFLIHPYTRYISFGGILWAFCVYLESVSVLPQLRMMQNAKVYETGGTYLQLIGHGYFWFPAALLAEMVQTFILADFCYYYIKRSLPLSDPNLKFRLLLRDQEQLVAMAASMQQAPTTPTADIVGNAFVHQYYLILHQSPELVHRFYQDVSKLGRPEEDGAMSMTTTMQAINNKILSLDYGEFTAEITTVDAQESYNGGVLVLVTGYLTGKDNERRKFTQSFFLAPQDKGYFVLNDVFRYVDDANHGNQTSINNVEAPITPDQDVSPVQENHVPDQTDVLSEEINEEEVYNPSENGDGTVEEEESPVAEVVDEIPDDTHMDAESNSKIEEVPKKSYASIVKVMKDSSVPISSSPTQASLRSIKSQEQQPASVSPPFLVAEKPVASMNAVDNGNSQEGVVEGPSVYLKGLPVNATHALVENEFKNFGTIRSGGIQIKMQKGFCFGFVEFEEETAVQRAIEASPILVSGRRVVVEPKKSTRGGNRGRFSSSAGNGYRNEGARERGNYGGGRGYGRGDFSNRSEFENRGGSRGGFSNRRGDGYQRSDQMGSNGGRVNRAGRMSVNATAKNVAPRVPAPA
ncbi:hypothetical protein Q3G72_035139 [Acer saccharum]|nr:hypothetical protein Q3G72_035139 [Acer saccharum]